MREKIRRFFAFALVCGVLFATSCDKDDAKAQEVTPTDTSAVSSEEVSSEEEHGHYFLPEDCNCNLLRLGMTVDEVKAVLGEPVKQIKYTTSASIDFTYAGLDLGFVKKQDGEYRLITISILDNYLGHNEDIALACGIKLGSTEADILACFDHPASIDPDEAETVLFTSNDKFTISNFYEVKSDESFTYGSREIMEGEAILYEFDYLCPPEWNKDKTSYTITTYFVQIWFYNHSDTVSYILCQEMIDNYSDVG